CGQSTVCGNHRYSLLTGRPVTQAIQTLPERAPVQGELVQVRSRRWLVDEVLPASVPGQSPLVRLACADDDAQGQTLEVYWDYELDRAVVAEEGWSEVAQRGFHAHSTLPVSL